MSLQWKSVILFVLIFVSACSTTVKVKNDLTYSGSVNPVNELSNGYVQFDTRFINAKGVIFDGGWVNRINTVLSDAFTKHNIPVKPGEGLNAYRLTTTVKILPEKALWKKTPLTGKNIGMASIPVAGLFTPRYYQVSTGFSMDFALLKNNSVIFTDSITIDESTQVSVSNSDRERESLEQAVRFWETHRNKAIEHFFSSFSQREAANVDLSVKSNN